MVWSYIVRTPKGQHLFRSGHFRSCQVHQCRTVCMLVCVGLHGLYWHTLWYVLWYVLAFIGVYCVWYILQVFVCIWTYWHFMCKYWYLFACICIYCTFGMCCVYCTELVCQKTELKSESKYKPLPVIWQSLLKAVPEDNQSFWLHI